MPVGRPRRGAGVSRYIARRRRTPRLHTYLYFLLLNEYTIYPCSPCGRSAVFERLTLILTFGVRQTIIHVMRIGTYDHYFEIADQLEKLGIEFSFAVKHDTGIVVFSNVEVPGVARRMMEAQDKTFRERFDPDTGQSQP